MAVTSDDIARDEMERNGLEKAISEVETSLGVSTPGTRELFQTFLQNAKGRVATLEKKIKDEIVEREQQAQQQAELVSLAQQETALSAREQQTYSGFLKEDFFTPNDFGRLEEFYAHTWDRLSERGKDEMSKRIWEGVRHNEYQFTDLPKDVQEKEEKRAYKLLSVSPDQAANVGRIPEQDRNDFIRAYESGNRQEAAKILDRDSFKQNMFRDAESREIRHSSVTLGRDTDSGKMVAQVKANTPKPEKDPSMPAANSPGDVDLSGINLGGSRLANNPSEGAVSNLPKAQTGAAREC